MVSEPKGVMEAVSGNSPAAVVFIPGPLALSAPRAWANAFAGADYLVVLGPDSKEMDRFMSFLDRIVFSPVSRKLASALLVHTPEEAQGLLDAVQAAGYKNLLIQEGGNA